jgi:hypothetical protein
MDFVLHRTLFDSPVVLCLLQLLDSDIQRLYRFLVLLCKLARLCALLSLVRFLVGCLEETIKVSILFGQFIELGLCLTNEGLALLKAQFGLCQINLHLLDALLVHFDLVLKRLGLLLELDVHALELLLFGTHHEQFLFSRRIPVKYSVLEPGHLTEHGRQLLILVHRFLYPVSRGLLTLVLLGQQRD